MLTHRCSITTQNTQVATQCTQFTGLEHHSSTGMSTTVHTQLASQSSSTVTHTAECHITSIITPNDHSRDTQLGLSSPHTAMPYDALTRDSRLLVETAQSLSVAFSTGSHRITQYQDFGEHGPRSKQGSKQADRWYAAFMCNEGHFSPRTRSSARGSVFKSGGYVLS